MSDDVDVVVAEPEVDLDEIGEELRTAHELTEPREVAGSGGRGSDFFHLGDVDEGEEWRSAFVDDLHEGVADGSEVVRVVRFGVGALLAVEDVVREDAFEGTAQDAFFTHTGGFELPRDVEDVFDQAVVTVGDADFEAGTHAHTVFAVE